MGRQSWFALIGMFIITSLLQVLLINKMQLSDNGISFLAVYIPSHQVGTLVIRTLYSILPIPILSFIVLGSLRDLMSGYSQLIVVRNYSRSKLVERRIVKMAAMVVGAGLFQIFLSICFEGRIKLTEIENVALSVLVYSMAILSAFMIGFIIELYVESQVAVLIVNSFFVFSLLLPVEGNRVVNFIFFPRLAFPNNTGALSGENNTEVIFTILFLSVIIIMSGAVCIKKLQRADIL